jgi:hypothetical protein
MVADPPGRPISSRRARVGLVAVVGVDDGEQGAAGQRLGPAAEKPLRGRAQPGQQPVRSQDGQGVGRAEGEHAEALGIVAALGTGTHWNSVHPRAPLHGQQ